MQKTMIQSLEEISSDSRPKRHLTKNDSCRRHWKENERLKCYWFILIFSDVFRKQDPTLKKKYKRDQNAIYKLMSVFVNTRNPTQCRTHVQKIKLGKFTSEQLRKMERQFYRDRKIPNMKCHRKKQILVHLDQLKKIYHQNKEKLQKVQKIKQKLDKFDFQQQYGDFLQGLLKCKTQYQSQQDQCANKQAEKSYRWNSEQVLIHFLFCQLYKKELNEGDFRKQKIFKKAQTFMGGMKDAGQIRSRYKKILTQWKEMTDNDSQQSEKLNQIMKHFERVYFRQRLLGIEHMKITISQYLECLKPKVEQNDMRQFRNKLNELKWQEQAEQCLVKNFIQQSNQGSDRNLYQGYQQLYSPIQQQDRQSQQIYEYNSILIQLENESQFGI